MFTYYVYKQHRSSNIKVFDIFLLFIVATAADAAILFWLWQGYTIIIGGG